MTDDPSLKEVLPRLVASLAEHVRDCPAVLLVETERGIEVAANIPPEDIRLLLTRAVEHFSRLISRN